MFATNLTNVRHTWILQARSPPAHAGQTGDTDITRRPIGSRKQLPSPPVLANIPESEKDLDINLGPITITEVNELIKKWQSAYSKAAFKDLPENMGY